MEYIVKQPWTGEIVDRLDPDKNQCIDGTCGGCDHCLLMQAAYYDYDIEDPDNKKED